MNEETERVKYIMHYWSKIQLARDFEELEKENQKLRKKIKYMEMIMEYKHELRQPQDESEIHNELFR